MESRSWNPVEFYEPKVMMPVLPATLLLIGAGVALADDWARNAVLPAGLTASFPPGAVDGEMVGSKSRN